MSNYIQSISSILASAVSDKGGLVVYGENITNGSKIVGIGRGLEQGKNYQLINVGNCESTHIGLGLGILLRGGKALLVAKQLDFMLLGLDQLVNTLNSIREMPNQPKGSFTILAVVCDQGFQGPQSSFNSAELIGDLSNSDVFFISDPAQAEYIFSNEIGRPGFRIILLSQRFFGEETGDKSTAFKVLEEGKVFQYENGTNGSILCFNFSVPQGKQLRNKHLEQKSEYNLFSCNFPLTDSFLKRGRDYFGKKIILIDDSKIQAGFIYKSAYLFYKNGFSDVEILKRDLPVKYGVGPDMMSLL